MGEFSAGGGGGIRTRGTLRYTVFPGPPVKPLLNPSKLLNKIVYLILTIRHTFHKFLD